MRRAGSSPATASPRRVAMDCLARREHSADELRRKLAARDFTPGEIDATLTDLEREGLLSDARFAEAFVAARWGRGQGPARLRAELAQRGLSNDLIMTALDAHDWFEGARAAREKKFGSESPTDYKDKARQIRFLQYRGFDGEQIRHALAGDWEHD